MPYVSRFFVLSLSAILFLTSGCTALLSTHRPKTAPEIHLRPSCSPATRPGRQSSLQNSFPTPANGTDANVSLRSFLRNPLPDVLDPLHWLPWPIDNYPSLNSIRPVSLPSRLEDVEPGDLAAALLRAIPHHAAERGRP